jgi:hypothetical protein
MILVGMMPDYLIGPYFFYAAVNATPYSTMLKTALGPRGRMDVAWLQHDRLQAHFTFSMRDVLNLFQPAGLAVVHRNLWHP